MVLTAATRQLLRSLRARQEPPLSQYALALKADLGFNRYWRIEKGYSFPTPEECDAIAQALGEDRIELFPEVFVA